MELFSYVMFGHGNLFGDIADIIHLKGLRLAKVVYNLDETRDDLFRRLERTSFVEPPKVLPLREFVPSPREHYIFGFLGPKRIALEQELLAKGLVFDTLIHPTAIVSPTAVVGAASIINAGAILASNVQVRSHVIVNRGATIGHDTVLQEYSIVAPGANIAGNVLVGRGANICLGANIAETLTIGSNSIVAAGAVVLHDVPDNVMVAGVPAKPIKTLEVSK